MSDSLPEGAVPEAQGRRGRPAWWVLAIGVAAVGVAVLVIAAVAPSLAGLISPAGPPVFQPSTLLEHRNSEYGVDEWRYATNLSGCEVYQWYQAQADSCHTSPLVNCQAAEASQSAPLQSETYSVGYCQGHVPFGDFTSDWEIYISDGYNEPDGRTHYLIAREVDWLPRTPSAAAPGTP